MTITKAIARARSRVALVPMGDQYTVHTWSPRHNATWMGNLTDYYRARAAYRESLILEALRALGVPEDEDHELEATAMTLAEEGGEWTSLVRDYARSHGLGAR